MKRLFLALLLFFSANIAIFYAALGRFESNLTYVTSGYHMHLIAFFGLSFLLSLVLIHEKIMLPAPFTLCFLYSSFIAVLIEILQQGTGYRVFSWYDVIAGMTGAGLYSLLGTMAFEADIFHKYWHRKARSN